MKIDFAEAKKAVRRKQRPAGRSLEAAHEASQRTLDEARVKAEDAIDTGSAVMRRTGKMAHSAQEWMEEKPHLAALAALAAGVVLGAILSPRR